MGPATSQLERLLSKYASVLDLAKQIGVSITSVDLDGGKLSIRGEAASQQARNRIYDQIKAVDELHSDIDCSIEDSGFTGGWQYYTVQPGDTLTRISEMFYGTDALTDQIIQANVDQFRLPNPMRVGQIIKIPTVD